MSKRQRLTARDEGKDILAEIERLESIVGGADEDLVNEAQELANKEVAIVEDSAEEHLIEDIGGENDRAMHNWPPMNASERKELATRLVGMAKRLMA
jgi:hypothetical protein